MSLIDSTYFVGDIALPNLDEVSNSFSDTIEKYESEVLEKLLGYSLYKEFKEDLVLGGGTPTEQRFIDLVNGIEFTFDFYGNTVTRYWDGLINDEKISLIAYYVYYKHRYENLSTTTSINDVQGIAENATKVNDNRKMVSAWNRGLDLYGELPISFSRYSVENYYYNGIPLFDKFSPSYDFYYDKPSAYNFLNANRATDYTNWEFQPLSRLNEFGI